MRYDPAIVDAFRTVYRDEENKVIPYLQVQGDFRSNFKFQRSKVPWWMERKQDQSAKTKYKTSVAFVLSNSVHQNAKMNLMRSHAEGLEIANTFHNLGYLTFLKTNLTGTQIKKWLADIKKFLTARKNLITHVLFYYTGHGMDVCKSPAMLGTDFRGVGEVHIHEHKMSSLVAREKHVHNHDEKDILEKRDELKTSYHEHEHEPKNLHIHTHTTKIPPSVVLFNDVDKILPAGSIIISNACRNEAFCIAKNKKGEIPVLFDEKQTPNKNVFAREEPTQCSLITAGVENQYVFDNARFPFMLQSSLDAVSNNATDVAERLRRYAKYLPTSNQNDLPDLIQPSKKM